MIAQVRPISIVRTLVLILLALSGAVGVAHAQPYAQTGSVPSVTSQVSGQYFVEFKGNGIPNDLPAQIASLGGTIVDSYPEVNVAILGGITADAATTLASRSDVADVTADYYFQKPLMPYVQGLSGPHSTLSPSSVLRPDTALFFPYQWNMRVIGADRAWGAGFLGSSDVRLAFLDSGPTLTVSA
jgi:hypothetical protein